MPESEFELEPIRLTGSVAYLVDIERLKRQLAEATARAEKAEREYAAILQWAFMLSDDSKVRRVDTDEDSAEIWEAMNEDGDYVTGDSAFDAMRKAAGLKENTS